MFGAKEVFRKRVEKQFQEFMDGPFKNLMGEQEPPDALRSLLYIAFLEGGAATHRRQLPGLAFLGIVAGLNIGFAIANIISLF